MYLLETEKGRAVVSAGVAEQLKAAAHEQGLALLVTALGTPTYGGLKGRRHG